MSARVPGELLEFINKEIEKADYQLVDVIARGVSSFEIVLDKLGGISLDECSAFNRAISAWIVQNNMFSTGCAIDVCSPGLDRALKSDNDFLWATGKLVTIKTHEPVGEKREISGKLIKLEETDDVVIEDENGSEISVSRKNIAKAKLKVCI